MEIKRQVTIENAIYGVLFLTALVVRIVRLGDVPFTESEANLALQSMNLFDPQGVFSVTQALYIVPVGGLFYLFGSSEWLARILPAVSGALLVLMPLLFRMELGRLPALFMAVALAFDPGLFWASRSADGAVMILLALFSAIGLIKNHHWVAGGICLGLAILGGAGTWNILFCGLVAAGIVWSTQRPSVDAENDEDGDSQKKPRIPGWVGMLNRKELWVTTVITVISVGSLCFITPRGLSLPLIGPLAALGGWQGTSEISPLQFMSALWAYEGLGILLLLFCIFRLTVNTFRRIKIDLTMDVFLIIWFFVTFIWALMYPSRQLSDMVQCLIPLWALAAREIQHHLSLEPIDRIAAAGHTTLVVVLTVFMFLNLAGLSSLPKVDWSPFVKTLGATEATYILETDAEPMVRMITLIGALGILGAVTYLIAWGWSAGVALRGVQWGGMLVMLVFTLSGIGRGIEPGRKIESEWWRFSSGMPERDLVLKTLHDYDGWNAVKSGYPDLIVVNVKSQVLRWELRNRREVSFVSSFPMGLRPAMVITQEMDNLNIAEFYRGQDYLLQKHPAYTLLAWNEWLRWWVLRDLPSTSENIILWVRADLFSGEMKTKLTP